MVCIGHPCFGIIIDGPLSKFGQNDIKDWFRIYGCSHGELCPRGFCVHIRGVAGLDVEYVTTLLQRVNNRTKLDLVLEDIPDIRAPEVMMLMSSFQNWRCTGNRKVEPGSLSNMAWENSEITKSSDSDSVH